MDGLLVVDKPAGPTSHDVVARVRKATGEPRVGHTGTLDPSTSGVLPLVLGRATRLARFLSASDKTYEAVIQLGVETDTHDAEGQPVGAAHAGPLPGRDEIDRALDAFRGTFMQTPPVYSAKKVAGLRSYTRARRRREERERPRPAFAREAHERPTAGQAPGRRLVRRSASEGGSAEREGGPAPVETTLAAVAVTVTELKLVKVEGDRLTLRVTCSAGFYVRALAHDLGRALGVGAHLAALRRTRSGGLTLADAVPLETLERDPAALARALIPPGRMLPELAAVRLTDEGARRARHGRDLGAGDFVEPLPPAASPPVRLLDTAGDLVGVAGPGRAPGLLHPAVVLM